MAFGALLGQNPGYTKEQTYSTATQALYPSGIDLPDQALALLSKAIVESQDGTELKNLMGDVIASLPLSGAQIETGTYVGTGTYGINNPNSLTFSFVPKLLIITAGTTNAGPCYFLGIFPGFALNNNFLTRGYYYLEGINWYSENHLAKIQENTISWYINTDQTIDPEEQFNYNGYTYHYIAIG